MAATAIRRACQTPGCGRTFLRASRYCERCQATLHRDNLCTWCAVRPPEKPRRSYCDECLAGFIAVSRLRDARESREQEILPELPTPSIRGPDAREHLKETKRGRD